MTGGSFINDPSLGTHTCYHQPPPHPRPSVNRAEVLTRRGLVTARGGAQVCRMQGCWAEAEFQGPKIPSSGRTRDTTPPVSVMRPF